MVLIVFLTISAVFCKEMVVTQEYTDYLKRHVDWEVVDYEENIFRGWTIDEVKALLIQELPEFDELLPNVEADTVLPSKFVRGANCIHGVRDEGNCGACWAFSIADMLADRCCLHTGKDPGFLSVQELLSCDPVSYGCQGGWPLWALDYIKRVDGLVPEACFPYRAQNLRCPTSCVGGSDWKNAHVCSCPSYSRCIGVEQIKTCLKTGPVVLAFYAPKSFFSYKCGIYKCDGPSLGLRVGLAIGYSEDPECYWIVKNCWGTKWGMEGYFYIACQTCGIHGNYPNGNVMCDKVY